MRSSPRHRLLSAALAAAFGTIFVSWSSLASAQVSEQAAAPTFDIRVPAQPLAAALNELSRQTGAQVFAAGDMVTGISAPAVSGRLTLQQALDRLLASSGLVAVRNGASQVTIQRASTATAGTSLPPVTVQATADGTTEGTGSYAARSASTSTRMDLSLRETPQSVSVIGRQQIEDQNLVTLDDVLRQTPGIVADRLDERVQFTSRGFALGTMIDGVPTFGFNSVAGEASMLSTAIYDRVEVLRGSAGLLNGVGSPGGAINLVRKRPTTEFSGHVTGGLGSWNRYNGEVDVGGPLNAAGTLRGRFVASRTAGNSFIESKKTSEDVLYGILEADLSPTTTLAVGIEHQKTATDGANYGQAPLFFSDGTRTNLPRSFNSSAPWSYWNMYSDKIFANLDQQLGGGWRLKLDASYLKAKRKRASGDLNTFYPVDATGESTIDIRDNPATSKNTSFDAHLRGPFEAFGRKHEAVLGLSYNDYDYSIDTNLAASTAFDTRPLNFYTLQSFPAVTYFPYKSYTLSGQTTEKAIYASTRLRLADPLSVIIGARGTWYKNDSLNRNQVAGTLTRNPGSHESGVITPYAGIVYDLSKEFSVYGSYTDIFLPNTERDSANKVISPQRGKNYEIGIKGEHFGGKLNTSFAVFRTKQSNVPVEDTSAGLLPDGSIPYRAVPGARGKGFELTASGELAPGWQMQAGYTYHAKRDNDGVLLDPTYPNRLFRVSTSYRLPGDWSKLTVGGSVSYQSSIYYDEASGLGRATQGGLTLIGLMARYEFDKKLSASLNIENLTDKRYYSGLGGYNGYTYGRPRNVWLKLTYKL
ncbi:TonB-dependent siderophore receptor [Variovorax guangxiensis]|uniref:TonB-dependent siderophore receptor n=1 Tax=Variovorax guangxiensis TaxID=1775474 RepID=A0A3S0ZRX8_9BURK|nr:TonB-dependent receptor [Variovorax guangxiensis]RUR70695.1 TonB-dependent siderophore receptor [Variovorax guangxiensis]